MASNDVCTHLPPKGRLFPSPEKCTYWTKMYTLYLPTTRCTERLLSRPPFHRMTDSAKTAWSFTTPRWAMYSLLSESHLTKNCLGKAFRVGSYRQLFTGLDFTCFLSGQQPADEGATSRNPSAAEYCTTLSSRKRLLTIRAYQPMRGTNSESLCSSI